MKLTDYVAHFLAEEGIKHVFGLTGGAVVHLFDSVARHPKITPIFNHHEQAAAFTAEAYARITNHLGVAFVTTGPGGTNAITGVCAAWLDSVPCVIISGQARFEHTSHGKPLRQLGVQEFDILSLVSHITKYSVMLDDPNMIRYHLQKAVYMAKTGRPGPVWIDIPLNFQWASIDPSELQSFVPPASEGNCEEINYKKNLIRQCLDLLQKAERPLVLAGYGIRLANAVKEFKKMVEILKIPFVASYNASDMMPANYELNIGRPGISGQRGANLAVQNCDFLLCVGSHLCISLTGTLFDAFAREAKIAMVDIDQVELENRTVRIDIPICCDAKEFLEEVLNEIKDCKLRNIQHWREKCTRYRKYNQIPQDWKKQKDFVNSYVFVDTLSDFLSNEDVIVIDGTGTVFYTCFQSFQTKEGQRLISSSGIATMGSGLPEGIGACLANGGKRTVCICGDGSMQLNVQELQTIIHNKLPLKIFIFNNGGYLSIRHTQKSFLESRYFGSSAEGGTTLPDYQKIASAYGMKAMKIRNHHEMEEIIREVLQEPGPVLCELMISREQEVIPSQGFQLRSDGTFTPRPLEDMFPYLGRKEFLENMIVKPWSSTKI